ncbi:MAG: hypothetical protein ACM3QY_11315 [Candidatus Levyibacteriota bacterium]
MVLRVEVGGPAHLYAHDVPPGAVAVGTVTRDSGAIGALLRFRNGTYAQMNGAMLRALDRAEVIGAMLDTKPALP